MPPSNLTKEQSEKLCELWEAGMTSVGDKTKLSEAVEATGLPEETIKNWIRDERKRKGLASKRAPREPANNTLKFVPVQKRKKSGYSVYKSTLLSGEKARKMIADGHGPGEVQKQANNAYRQPTPEEKEGLRKAAEKNRDPTDARIPRQQLIRKIVANIHANMQTLDQLGCPSIWLGYNGSAPERLFSAQMCNLAEDATFTNYVVSTMVNKLSKTQMAKVTEDASATSEKKKKRKKKSGKSGSQNDPKKVRVTSTPPVASTTLNNEPDASTIGSEEDEVELLDKEMKLVCRGFVSPNQTQVHGRALSSGWVVVMIQDVLSKGKVEPWQEYPSNSGEVEEGSFVAWPTAHIRPHQSVPKPNFRPHQSVPKPNLPETEVLKDVLHPEKFVSPRCRT